MDNTAIVTTLMKADGFLLFKNPQFQSWFLFQQFIGCSKSHDSAADDDYIIHKVLFSALSSSPC